MLNATIAQRVEITSDLVILKIKPDAGVPAFLPGQYVALGLPGSAPRPEGAPPAREEVAADKLVKRAYSIASAPHEGEHIELYLAILPDGTLTSRIALLKEGDRIFIAPKIVGTFTLAEVPADHDLILVATGTGLAPYISMLRTPATWTPGRKITVIHGVRYAADLAYRDELTALAQERPDLRYFPIISRPQPGWQGEAGYAQKFFTDGRVGLNPARDHVFLCGNPGMVEEVQALLESRGFTVHARKTPGNIHLEKYW